MADNRVKAALAEIYGRTSTREDAVIPGGKLSAQVWGKLTPEKASVRRVGKVARGANRR